MEKNLRRDLDSPSSDVIFDLSMHLSSYAARYIIIHLIMSSNFKVITLFSPTSRQLHNTIPLTIEYIINTTYKEHRMWTIPAKVLILHCPYCNLGSSH